jgi:hypothetical protein
LVYVRRKLCAHSRVEIRTRFAPCFEWNYLLLTAIFYLFSSYVMCDVPILSAKLFVGVLRALSAVVCHERVGHFAEFLMQLYSEDACRLVD